MTTDVSFENINPIDRVFRFTIGFTVIVYFTANPIADTILMVLFHLIASAIVFTSIIGVDPIYTSFRQLVFRSNGQQSAIENHRHVNAA